MSKCIRILNTSIKKSYLNTFEKILNHVILNNKVDNEDDDSLCKCNTTYYVYLLGLIVDERNRTEQNNFYSILDDTNVILKDFDIEEFFKTKRKKNKYYINPNEPGPIDPLRIDFDL
jgi:hypothetical protein